MGLRRGTLCGNIELRIRPLLAGLPIGVDLLAELAAGLDLLLRKRGLFSSKKARTRLALHGLSEAEVGPVPGFVIVGAGAIGLATPYGALGNRTAAHGSRLSQFGGKSVNVGRNVGRSGHDSSYGIQRRKTSM